MWAIDHIFQLSAFPLRSLTCDSIACLIASRSDSVKSFLPQAGLSDSQIAEHVGVSQPFVGKLRKELEADGQLETVSSRTGKDGRTTNTANIGGKATTASPLAVEMEIALRAVDRPRLRLTAFRGETCETMIESHRGSPLK